MPRPFARRCRAVAALSLLAAACSYPTDSSSGAWVKVHSPVFFIVRGTDTVLDAHVYQLEHGKDTVEIKNVEITWATSDPQLVTVAPLPGRRARVTGVNPGNVIITATAAAYQSAAAGADTLHVANPLEVFSVSPRIVKYGQEVTVVGVGAENADVIFLGSQALIVNPFVGGVDTATGLGYRNFWVPFPVRSHDSVTVIGNAIVDQLFNPIAVEDTVDIFDPNMTSPATIDIDLHPYSSGPVAVPTFKDVIAFYNPALFAEDPRLQPYRADWFRLASAQPDSAFTFVYIAPQLFGREVTYLSAPVTSSTLTTGGSWTYGSGHYRCKGWDFDPAEAPSAGFQVAFTKLPPGGTDLVSLFADRGQYELVIVHGYFGTLRPDRYEGNNTCDFADANFAIPSLHIDLAAPFADTLNIDNNFDIDWLRFHVPGLIPQVVTIKLRSKSTQVLGPDQSDIVLYVLNIPTSTVPLAIKGSATTGGRNKSLTLTLNPGDYYLVAHDSVGQTANYALCMAVGATCVLPALPAVSADMSRPLAKRELGRAENFQQRLAQAQADARKRRAAAMSAVPYEELRQRLIRELEGRYAMGGLLGAGGMAAVFRAQDISLDRVVAIKVLPPDLTHDEKVVSRFEQEARIAAKLDHPNIIPIYRVESEGGLHYFVMKFVAGRSLDSILADGQRLDIEFTQRVLEEAALALGHAHKRGVVHRDVKPANIMLDEDGRVILTDFGISKAIESASGLTRTGMIVGTPHYMAPEQAMGEDVDGRADQYGLACVGYHMLTGELPFPGDVVHSVLHRHIYEDAKPLGPARKEAPRSLVRALERAMAKQPKDRFGSMEEFADALSMYATGSRAVRRSGVPLTMSSEGPTAPNDSSATVRYENAMRSGKGWRVVRWTAGLAAVAAAGVFIARQQAPVIGVPAPPVPVTADSISATGGVPVDSARDTSAAVPVAVVAAPPSKLDRLIHRNTPKPKPAAPPPRESADSALFSVLSEPYGMLYLNGKEIDNTPLINMKVAVGRTYDVRIERDGYKPFHTTITVKDQNPKTLHPHLEQVP